MSPLSAQKGSQLAEETKTLRTKGTCGFFVPQRPPVGTIRAGTAYKRQLAAAASWACPFTSRKSTFISSGLIAFISRSLVWTTTQTGGSPAQYRRCRKLRLGIRAMAR